MTAKKGTGKVPAKIKLFSILIGLIILVLLAWGVLIEPRLIDEVHQVGKIPNLPVQWKGKQIALITDMQTGMWLDNEDTVRRIIKRIVKEAPAAVLIGGDFIYNPTEDDSKAEAREEYGEEEETKTRELIQKVIRNLDPLIEAGLPVYAVFGNHDYAMETQKALKLSWVAGELRAALKEAGIKVLQNEFAELKGKTVAGENQFLYIVGIGAYYPGEDNVKKAFFGLPNNAPRVVLMHNPQSFKTIPPNQADRKSTRLNSSHYS